MSGKNKKIIKAVIGVLGMLILAFVIWVCCAVAFKWDVLSWFTSTQAYLVYALVFVALCVLVFLIINYISRWGDK